MKQALGEFKRRAVKSGKLGASDTVLVGDVVDVKTQVRGLRLNLQVLRTTVISIMYCTIEIFDNHNLIQCSEPYSLVSRQSYIICSN